MDGHCVCFWCMSECVSVRLCVCACVCTFVRAFVRSCVRAFVLSCVRAFRLPYLVKAGSLLVNEPNVDVNSRRGRDGNLVLVDTARDGARLRGVDRVARLVRVRVLAPPQHTLAKRTLFPKVTPCLFRRRRRLGIVRIVGCLGHTSIARRRRDVQRERPRINRNRKLLCRRSNLPTHTISPHTYTHTYIHTMRENNNVPEWWCKRWTRAKSNLQPCCGTSLPHRSETPCAKAEPSHPFQTGPFVQATDALRPRRTQPAAQSQQPTPASFSQKKFPRHVMS